MTGWKGGIAGIAVALAAQVLCAQPAAAPDFQREIRPILSDHCFRCHGPDASSRMVNLRLDRKADALAARADGTPIIPGKSAESLVYQRISETNVNRRMPPEVIHNPLKPEEIALVKRWIDSGAAWKEQWSYQAPVKAPLPAVKNEAWAKNAIDRFILARLEAEGLTPAPEADRRTLIRRVALDATGLPPKPYEIEAFLADQEPGAYERMVDRYLASPHYGEHRARYWLDAVRYGDTNGIHFDNYRSIWPYRDWVIAAYNRNEPFNLFGIEQIAGDLLPHPTIDQLVATGFQRCGVTTNEAGIIEDEYAEIYAKDRADTFGAVFLGMTVGCATCHDHKFDPIPQRDFYSLGAFFRNTTEKIMDGNVSDASPAMMVPRQEDREAWTKLTLQLAELQTKMDDARREAAGPFEQWLHGRKPGALEDPLTGKGAAYVADLAAIVAASPNVILRQAPGSAKTAIGFAQNGGAMAGVAPKLDADKPFTVSAIFQVKDDKGYAIANQVNPRDRNRGWSLDINEGLPAFHLTGDNGARVDIRADYSEKIKAGEWTSVMAVYDGSREQYGLDLYINGRLAATQGRAAMTKVNGSIGVDDPVRLGGMDGGAIADVRIFDRALTPEDAELLSRWPATEDGLGKASSEETAANKTALLEYFTARQYAPFEKLADQQVKLYADSKTIERRGAITLIMRERTDQKPFAYTLYRGAYDQKRVRVDANTPSILPPMAANLPHNRLGLAQWLFDPANPVTARVAVNRMWEEIFGTGIVRTADDFGSQGEPPSHPELLDWLAVDFRENGWDVKRMYREIFLSAAYRQEAKATPEKIAKDPNNRLISRGPRFRMDGEMLRDTALAASGLLDPEIGGPSVKPYQPPGIWEAVAMNDSNTRFYKQDSGNGLYRRSVYTLWKRAAPPASMEILNAPTRESCTVRRERTDTPLQALATMNDVQFVEAARVLAGGAIEAATTFDGQLDYIAVRVLARPANAEERKIARAAYDDFAKYYAAHPEDARKFLNEGEHKPDPALPAATYAALAMVANEVLNLDEAMNQ